ncbi:hypothetical protein MnTg02_01456 [bacterium MnTg02]|nr:hypothetical protein MnTg02_01456 [bacterium MnTg02]
MAAGLFMARRFERRTGSGSALPGLFDNCNCLFLYAARLMAWFALFLCQGKPMPGHAACLV